MHAMFLIAGLAMAALAAPRAPEKEWAAGIAEQNKTYAQVPHAMLKIQDSVYLGEGESAVLLGRPGDAGSWHWSQKPKMAGALAVTLKGGTLSATRDGRALKESEVADGVKVDKDVDIAGQQTQVGAGINGWRLFVYNQNNPEARNFRGVSYFPYDPAYRVTAEFKPDAKLPPQIFNTSRGTAKQFYHAGDARFTLEGKTVTLPFYAESKEPGAIKSMSAFFTDGLTGQGAYGAGRYLDVRDFGAYPPKSVVIDFNRAYNPNCARSPHFTCPVTIDSIPLAIKAGERDPHLAH